MSKRIRNLIIAAVALLVVGIGVATVLFLLPEPDAPVTDDTPTEPTEAPAIVIVDKRTDANGKTVSDPVTTLEIVNAKDTFTVSKNDDGTMCVEQYADLPVDASAVESLCNSAAYLTAVLTPEAKEDDAAYGLASPSATVHVTYHDGTTDTIVFGDPSKGSDGYYCRREGDETLYLVDPTVAGNFLKDGKAFIGKTLIVPPAPDQGDEEGAPGLFRLWLTGSNHEKPIEIVTDTDGRYPALTYTSTFYMKAPYLRALDSDLFSSMSGMMVYLTATGVEAVHPTAEQLGEYGLDDPHSVAAFTLAVLATSAADGGGTKTTHYNDREHMVMLGNTDEDGNYYALVNGADIVYLLSPASVPWAETTYVDLVSKLLFLKNVTTVDTMTVTDEGKATTFELTHYPDKEKRNDQLVVKANGKTYNTADFRTIYAMMLSVHRVDEKEAGATPAGEPVISWALTFNDGSEPLKVSLYEMTASRYLCVMQDGEESAVSIRDVEDFQKQYRNYLAGDPVVTPY